MGPLILRYIEPATPEYAEAAAVRYEALYVPLGLSRDLIADRDRRRYLHLAARMGGRVVGYARLHLEDGESKVYQLSVAEDARRRGVGRALMEELIRVARGIGRERIVLDSRVEAVGFYERLGFRSVGETFLSERTGTPHRHMVLELG